MSRSRSFALYLALAVLIAAPLTVTAHQQPSTEQLKEEAEQMVASMQKMSQEILDSIFSFGELGFQEFWTTEYITGILAAEGFDVEMGCAGMPTCYVASWGSGKPVIGFMGDIDGLPETSQKPGVAYHDPLIEGGPGHGEGHNSAAAVDLVGAIVTKRLMEKYGLQGTLKVIPGVAEELVSSRTYRVNDGLFEGMDIMLASHISQPRANMEQQGREFVQNSLKRRLVRWEQRLGAELIGPDEDDLFFEFLLEDLLSGDAKTRAAVYSQYVQLGVLTRNEVRIAENRIPLPGLSEPLTPLNMQREGQPSGLGGDDDDERRGPARAEAVLRGVEALFPKRELLASRNGHSRT